MTIETRDFGTVEVSEDGILEFKLPILGFESQKHFVILYDDELGDSLAWLQSVTEKDVCFIIVDPLTLLSSYTPELSGAIESDLKLAGAKTVFRCLVVIPDLLSEATVNLRSPIVINPEKKLAAQVVLDENYPIRALLKSFEGGTLC